MAVRSVRDGSGIDVRRVGDSVVVDNTRGGGESNDGENLASSGARVYAGMNGDTLQFRRLAEGTGVSLSEGDGTVTVSATGGSNDGATLGTGDASVYAGMNGDTLQFRHLDGGTGIALSEDSEGVTASATTAGTNLGSTGAGLYAGKTGDALEFRRLVDGSNVSLSAGTDAITIDAADTDTHAGVSDDGSSVLSDVTDIDFAANLAVTDQGDGSVAVDATDTGEVNDGSNLGTGAGVYAGKSGSTLEFRSLAGSGSVSVSSASGEVTISGSGEANTASNVGTGDGLFRGKSGTDLEFRSLVAGQNLSATVGTDELTLDATDTHTDVSDSQAGVTVSDVDDIDFGASLSVADDGDGTVTADVNLSIGDVAQNGAADGQVVTWDGSAWKTDFPGTTADTAFDLLAGGTRALRLDPDSGSNEVAVVGGHPNNAAHSYGTTVGGGGPDADGNANVVYDSGGTVGGGRGNQAGSSGTSSSNEATVGGGYQNTANAGKATVAGGNGNTASGQESTVAGGYTNAASGNYSTVAGGSGNTASGLKSAVAGGTSNTAGAQESAVGGGYNNAASGQYSAVPGGINNAASGDYAFAGGRRAKANDVGAFVWADSQSSDFASNTDYNSSGVTGSDTFHARAQNGVRFVTAGGTTFLDGNGGGWNTTSTKAAKTNFQSVDPENALEGVQSLDIATWEYKDDDGEGLGVEHMGPVAEDFDEAFGLGDSDEYINSINADGVAFAAIQGLAERLRRTSDRVAELESTADSLRGDVDDLESEVDDLAAENDDLRAENDELRDRCDDLEERLAAVEARLDGE
ncbi:tail fiber domain-containing protein [Halomicrobium salinisoli]|uniref:tail fiber domain-containing protein n=1 Tax=Halomicrobium salinisoli TaxID=2878391 RepID=UPI001CF02862|nr:tail fiber domain-containing protein [Halomicrobium salinisoli]